MARRTCSISCSLTATLFLFQGLLVLTHPSVLRSRTERSSPGCPQRWNGFGNKCYRMFGGQQVLERENWTQANRRCEVIGSTLVSIHSMEEQAYLSDYVSIAETDVWIGLHLPANQRTFRWTDDSRLNFTYWEEGEPNYFNEEEECVHMNHEGTAVGKWNDQRCVNVFPFICQIPADTCGGSIVSDRGFISSPNYPNRYGRNAECVWMITVPEDNRINLRFSSFEVEEDKEHECSYDYVKILDGHEAGSHVLAKYCGIEIPEDVFSTGNEITVLFKSDFSNQYQGFAAEFMRVGCGENIIAETGVISSPDFPYRYPPNSDCIWWITVPEDHHIVFKFNSFEVEGDETDECGYDYVEVLDGHHLNSPILGKYCGENIVIPEVIISSGNKMSIKFKSDSSFQYEGFTAEFNTVAG